MSSALIIGLEMTLVLGGVLGFGIWELLSLRRDRARSTEKIEEKTKDKTKEKAPAP